MHEIANFPLEHVIFCGNNNEFQESNRLYISYDGNYNTIPIGTDKALDDKDDLTIEQYSGTN